MRSHTTHHDGCDCVMDKMQKLEAENARLRKALEFYADAKSIRSSDPYCVVWEGWSYSGYDKRPIEIGTKAREALMGDITPDKGGNK